MSEQAKALVAKWRAHQDAEGWNYQPAHSAYEALDTCADELEAILSTPAQENPGSTVSGEADFYVRENHYVAVFDGDPTAGASRLVSFKGFDAGAYIYSSTTPPASAQGEAVTRMDGADQCPHCGGWNKRSVPIPCCDKYTPPAPSAADAVDGMRCADCGTVGTVLFECVACSHGNYPTPTEDTEPLAPVSGREGGAWPDDAVCKSAITARNEYLEQHPGDALGGMRAALAAAAPQAPVGGIHVSADDRLVRHVFALRKAAEGVLAWAKRNMLPSNVPDPARDVLAPLHKAVLESHNLAAAPPALTQPVDGCTESNCPRCKLPPYARGDIPHAGIGWQPAPSSPNKVRVHPADGGEEAK